MSTNVFFHYNAELKLIITVDASPVGVDAVFSHIMTDGSEKPLYFASMTLSRAERNYVRIEREELAVIFGVSKFHKYIYGREFTIITDHKPLPGLFKDDHAISLKGNGKEQRWALVLTNYHYQQVFKPCTKISHADGLSRLPLEDYFMPLSCPKEIVLSLSALDLTLTTSKTCFLHIKRSSVITSA